MDALALVLLFALVAWFVVRAWKAHGRLSAPDRWALITSFAVALTPFVIGRLVINWVALPAAIWLIAVALLTGGVVGAALRWPKLAWIGGAHPIRRVIVVGVTLVGCALIMGLAVI